MMKFVVLLVLAVLFRNVCAAPIYARSCVFIASEDVEVLTASDRGLLLPCASNSVAGASASFDDSVEKIGWARLNVRMETSKELTPYLSGLAMGFAEGVLTFSRIGQQIRNYYNSSFISSSGKVPPNTAAFLRNQLLWVRKAVASASLEDAYWQAQAMVLGQFDGIVRGYARFSGASIPDAEAEIYATNSNDDISDLISLFDPTAAPKKDYLAYTMTSCSAFIRLLSNNSDIITGHTTWRPYWGMLRIFKHYQFLDEGSPAIVSFSSAPGIVSSHDDFFVTGARLAIMETTNDMFNLDYQRKYVTTNSFLSWQRAAVANILSHSGEDWVDFFGRYNSGTYSNQWMIVNYGLFSPHRPLVPGTIVVSEQLPNRMVTGDMSEFVEEQQYWPSYNIPFFPEVFNISGYPEMVEKYGDQFSYQKCPRARIFGRNASLTHSLLDVQNLLRFNDWQHDPLSLGSAKNAVASRYDLLTGTPYAFGGADSKVTTFALSEFAAAIGISGPTANQQIPFKWSTSPFSSSPHEGLPDEFDFDWELFVPAVDF
eukprot:ANDGO_05030.mRNA.1 Phospholipase B-like protein G